MAFKPSIHRYSSKIMSLSKSNDENLASEIMSAESCVVLFSSTSHSSCQYMNQQYEKLVQNHLSRNQEWKIFAIDAIEHPEVAMALGIKSIPSIATLKNGYLQFTHMVLQ